MCGLHTAYEPLWLLWRFMGGSWATDMLVASGWDSFKAVLPPLCNSPARYIIWQLGEMARLIEGISIV